MRRRVGLVLFALVALVTAGCTKERASESPAQPIGPSDGEASMKVAPADPAPSAPAPAAPSAPKDNVVTASTLDWSMKKSGDGSSIVIIANVKNTTDAPIWVADRLVVPAPGNKFTRTDRLTVMNTDDPAVIRFVAGAVSSDRPSAQLYKPTFTEFAPGASVERTWTIPSPLKSWNPVGGANPLSDKAKQAVFLLHTSTVPPSAMNKIASDDPTPLETPDFPRAMQIVTGAALPLL
jgi:hypothetical protein